MSVMRVTLIAILCVAAVTTQTETPEKLYEWVCQKARSECAGSSLRLRCEHDVKLGIIKSLEHSVAPALHQGIVKLQAADASTNPAALEEELNRYELNIAEGAALPVEELNKYAVELKARIEHAKEKITQLQKNQKTVEMMAVFELQRLETLGEKLTALIKDRATAENTTEKQTAITSDSFYRGIESLEMKIETDRRADTANLDDLFNAQAALEQTLKQYKTDVSAVHSQISASM